MLGVCRAIDDGTAVSKRRKRWIADEQPWSAPQS
jgi:hypothetical protein